MALPTIFAALPAGNELASALDTNYNAVGAGTIIACAAVGSNSIALAPFVNQITISAYVNYMQFSFAAAGTSSGSVTVNVNSLGALNLYKNATTQAGANDIISGVIYQIAYNSALNSGAGGLQLIGGSTGALTKSFVSSQQSITAAGSLTIAHGLGVVPQFITAELVCLTNDQDFAAGEIIQFPIGANFSTGQGMAVRKDSTVSIFVRFGSATNTFSYVENATGTTVNLTNANWALVLRAYA